MSKKDTVTDATFEEVQDTGAGPGNPEENQGLSLNDIGACVSIIDIVSKRGAFEGQEMADVGAVRNRLATFLDAAKAAQDAGEEGANA
jgi:hypothetical protein